MKIFCSIDKQIMLQQINIAYWHNHVIGISYLNYIIIKFVEISCQIFITLSILKT